MCFCFLGFDILYAVSFLIIIQKRRLWKIAHISSSKQIQNVILVFKSDILEHQQMDINLFLELVCPMYVMYDEFTHIRMWPSKLMAKERYNSGTKGWILGVCFKLPFCVGGCFLSFWCFEDYSLHRYNVYTFKTSGNFHKEQMNVCCCNGHFYITIFILSVVN